MNFFHLSIAEEFRNFLTSRWRSVSMLRLPRETNNTVQQLATQFIFSFEVFPQKEIYKE